MSRAFVSICALAALVCSLSAPAAASFADRDTRFTFSKPIALPGVTLPAGTYTFRLVDPTTGGKVVQILDESGTRSYAMLLSIPAARPDVPKKPEVSFMETAADMPAAVKTWWQEGSTVGHEFVYPSEQALRLTRGAIPASVVADARRSSAADLEGIAQSSTYGKPARQAIEGRRNAFRSTRAANQPGQPAQPLLVTAQESTLAPDQATRKELPWTTSLLPLMVILGTLILFGGAWLRHKRRV